MRKLLFTLLGIVGLFTQLLAQNRVITGRIADQQGVGLANVTVTVKGTEIATSTKPDGTFSIEVPPTGRTLVVTYVGYQNQEIAISQSANYNVSLNQADNSMDELVVVAYGTVKKGENTASTAQVNYNNFKNRPITSPAAALEGAAPGIQVLATSGQPGSGPTIRLRGFGSINASNDPLYVVDGVVYSGGLSNINMDDVESVSALKDAASTALYGSRGANGVVIITTKKGRKGRNGMSFKMTQGYTSRAIPEYERVDAYQYYPLMWQAYRNALAYGNTTTIPLADANRLASGLFPRIATGTNAGRQLYNGSAYSDITQLLAYNPFNVPRTEVVLPDGTLNPNAQLLWEDDLDWGKDIERQGTRQEYSLNFNGGADRSDYFASLGYVDEKGFIVNSDQKRFMGRLNVNAQPLNWFRTGINLSGTYSTSNQASTGSSTGYVNPFNFIRNMGPIYPLYAHNQTTGAYLLDANGNRFYDFGNMSSIGIPNRAAGGSPGRHIAAETIMNRNLYKRNILSARTFGEISFTKDLKFTSNVAVDMTNLNESTYDNNIIGDGAPAGRASKEGTLTTSYTLNQLLNYSRKFGQHNVSALAGHENYDLTINNNSASRQNQVVTGNYELDNFTTTNSVASYTDRHKIESWLSRVNYDFDGKYLLSGSFRRDGNSRFKSDVRWENFWSFGAAWRIDREAFMNGIEWVNALKLRASTGRVGNDGGLGYYPYQALYALGFNNAGEPGIRQSALSNDSITWEGQRSSDIALEFGLFKNRINGTIEYYSRNSDDLIFGVQLPLSMGGYTLNKNIGSMVNKGWEFQLNGDVIRKRDFNWNLGLNVSTLHNEITKMPDYQPEIISGTKKLMVGKSVYDFWLRDYQGVDPTDGSALYRANLYSASNSRIRGKDDTVTVSQNNAKYIYAGSAIPDFWGSISNTLNFKGFELNVLLTYQIGGKIYDGVYQGLMSAGTYGSAYHVDALRAWKNPGDITDIPRMDAAKGSVFDAQSDRWLIDASFLSVRNVSFGYNIPTALASKIQAGSVRVFINGENLGWFSKRQGMNVQQTFTGVTSNVYVPARVITAGINVNF
jgi:TonB-linked SusC/RagA family outer membrane protein